MISYIVIKFSWGKINDFKVVHLRLMNMCGVNGKGRLTSNVFLASSEKLPGRFTDIGAFTLLTIKFVDYIRLNVFGDTILVFK